MTLIPRGGRKYGMMTTNFPTCLTVFVKGLEMCHNSLCTYNLLPGQRLLCALTKAANARLQKGGSYHSYIEQTFGLMHRANRHYLRAFNFQQGVVKVKTEESNVSLNKRGQVQLFELQNRICICKKPQFYGYYCSTC